MTLHPTKVGEDNPGYIVRAKEGLDGCEYLSDVPFVKSGTSHIAAHDAAHCTAHHTAHHLMCDLVYHPVYHLASVCLSRWFSLTVSRMQRTVSNLLCVIECAHRHCNHGRDNRHVEDSRLL